MEYVYVGKGASDPYFKIGRTANAQENRLKQHKTANPSFNYSKVIPTSCASDLEKTLHLWFSSKRVPETKEWFDLKPEDLDILTLFAEGHEENRRITDDAELLKGQRSSGSYVDPCDSVMENYERLRILREQAARIGYEIESIENRMKIHVGRHDGITGLLSWKSFEERRFDSKIFRTNYPDLYEQFRIPGIRRIFRLV